MDELKKIFDSYSLTARVKPAFFLVFPAVLSLFVLYEPCRSWGGASISLLISFGVIHFAASQMSTKGNILQEKLFSKWGGAATTIVLRHSDSRLSGVTKERYMEKLESIMQGFVTVSRDQEADAPQKADEMYRAACDYMREHTRDNKKFPLVFKELKNYGFSRNVCAFKWVGVLVSLVSIGASLLVVWVKFIEDSEVKSYLELLHLIPVEYMGLIISLVLVTLLWVCLVTEKWVEVRAFAYAKALFAACEKM